MRKFLTLPLMTMAFALTSLVAVPVMAADRTPDQIAQSIVDELGATIEGHRDELQTDRGKLIDVIDDVFLPHFDLDYATILVLGQNAKTATPDQRSRFAKAFYNSLTRKYAEGLLNFSRGAVKVLPSRGELNSKRTIIRTQITLDDGKLASVDFAFRKGSAGAWKAYDVIIEGISYITNYRNQVDAEIQKSGIEALIKRLGTQGDEALQSMDKDQKG